MEKLVMEMGSISILYVGLFVLEEKMNREGA